MFLGNIIFFKKWSSVFYIEVFKLPNYTEAIPFGQTVNIGKTKI